MFSGLSTFKTLGLGLNNFSRFVHLRETWLGNNVSWFVHRPLRNLGGNNITWFVLTCFTARKVPLKNSKVLAEVCAQTCSVACM